MLDLSAPIAPSVDLGFFDPATRVAYINEMCGDLGVTPDEGAMDATLTTVATVLGGRPQTIGELVGAMGRAIAGNMIGLAMASVPSA